MYLLIYSYLISIHNQIFPSSSAMEIFDDYNVCFNSCILWHYFLADVEGFDEDSFKSLFKFGKDEIALQIFYLLIPVCKSVVALARYTSFFGENIQFHSPEDMLENDEVLSIASLIMKFSLTTMKEGGKVRI